MARFVDVHGRDLDGVLATDSGDYLVPLSEIRRTGFSIYKKSVYNKLLIEDGQLNAEFNLHLLHCAKDYMLENKCPFSPEEVLNAIRNVEKTIQSEHIQTQTPTTSRNNILSGRRIETDPTNGIRIQTSNLTIGNVNELNKKNGLNQKVESAASSLNGYGSSRAPSRQSERQPRAEPLFVENDNVNTTVRPPNEQPQNFVNRSYNNNNNNSNRSRPSSNSNYQRRSDPIPNRQTSNESAPKFSPKNDNGSCKNQRRSDGFDPSSSNVVQKNAGSDNFQQNGRKNGSSERVWNDPSPDAIQLENEKFYEGTVSHTGPEKTTVAWLQLNLNRVIELLDILNNGQEMPVDTPAFDKLFVAKHEDEWHRAKVERLKPLTVYFVDWGNTAEVAELRKIPEHIKAVPYQAVRVSCRPQEFNGFQVDDNLKFKVLFRYDDGTFCIKPTDSATQKTETVNATPAVSEPVNEVKPEKPTPKVEPQTESPKPEIRAKTPEPEPEPTFFTLPPQASKLEDNTVVVIHEEDEGHLILRTRNDVLVGLKNVEVHLNNYSGKPVAEVKKGQLVVCPQSDRKNGPARAIIEEVEDDSVKVRYLDYFGTSTMHMELCSSIDEALAKMPLTYIKSPKFIYEYSQEGKDYIKELKAKKPSPKYKVKLVGNQIDLILDDGTPLSDVLKNVEHPRPLSPDRLMFNNVKTVTPKFGLSEYFVYSIKSIDSVTIIPEDHPDLEKLMIPGEVLANQEAYVPVINEICLAYFEEAWSRILVDARIGNKYHCEFVDFGNVETVEPENLRKLTDDLKQLPILGVKAQFSGISNSEFVRLKEIMKDGDVYEINVVGENASKNKYSIEIPSLYKQL